MLERGKEDGAHYGPALYMVREEQERHLAWLQMKLASAVITQLLLTKACPGQACCQHF